MSHYFPESAGMPRRTLAGTGIVALHVLFVYLLATALGHKTLAIQIPPVQSVVIDDLRQPPTPPPLSDPKLDPNFIDTTPLQPPPWTDPQKDPPAERLLTHVGDEVLPPPQPPVVKEVQSVRLLGQNRLPNSEEFYPPDLRRQGIEGATTVRVCVDEKGVRSGNPVVELSSGNARLDEGALKVARSGRYARSVQGITPVPNCFRFHIGFQIK